MSAKPQIKRNPTPTRRTPAKSAKAPIARAKPTKATTVGKKPRQTSAVAARPAALSAPQQFASKQAQLVDLLRAGATMEQMMSLTQWQAHTVRGTISGVLRKRLGLTVEVSSSQPGAPRLYRITSATAA